MGSDEHVGEEDEDEALSFGITRFRAIGWTGDVQRSFPTQMIGLFRLFLTLFIHRRNLVESVTKQYLKKCTYHKVTDSLCPVFDLGYIVKESGQNFTFLAVKVLEFQMLFLADVERGTVTEQSSPNC